MSTRGERRMILAMVEDGKITPEEGLRLLKVLADSENNADDPEAGFAVLESGLEADDINAEAHATDLEAEDDPQVLDGTVETPRSSAPPNADKWRSW